MKRKSFTIAEILVTLAIIGVVAAMTMPVIYVKYKEQITIVKVKKTYSVLSQAFKLAGAHNDRVDLWNFEEEYSKESADEFWSHLKQYFLIAQDCGDKRECYADTPVKKLNGQNQASYNLLDSYYKVILNDGISLWFRTGSGERCTATEGGIDNVCAVFWIDTDGIKGANTLGRDVFIFVATQDGVVPYKSDSNGNDTCNMQGSGTSCAQYIIKNGKMDYIKHNIQEIIDNLNP